MSHISVDREALKRKLQAEYEAMLTKVMDAVDQAPDGSWIEGSEMQTREACDSFRRTIFEAALQAKLDAAEAAFPPSG